MKQLINHLIPSLKHCLSLISTCTCYLSPLQFPALLNACPWWPSDGCLSLFEEMGPTKTRGHIQTCVQSFLVVSCTISSWALGPDPQLVLSKMARTSLPPLDPHPVFLPWSGRDWETAGRGWKSAKEEKDELPSASLLPGGLAPIPQESEASRDSP